MVMVSGSANRYIGIRSMVVPVVISTRIVTAPRYLPTTICQGRSGRVSSSSMVWPSHSLANSRMEMAGLTTVSNIPMFCNVASIVAVFDRKTL